MKSVIGTMHPRIIQGGMGIGVSGWNLAKTVAVQDQLGVVSATAIEMLFARRLQLGDLDGNLRRALDHFPIPSLKNEVLDQYFITAGKPSWKAFKPIPLFSIISPPFLMGLTMVASFVEIFLAKEGHQGKIGVNLLEKIQFPTLPALYGAMLAGVDYVLIGAGIPKAIPMVLDCFAQGKTAEIPLHVEGHSASEKIQLSLNPKDYFTYPPKLKKPYFFPIVASHVLAAHLSKKKEDIIDGFVVETPSAGGHNAPPRGVMQIDQRGEPIYGERDETDWSVMRSLGKPFWIGGNFGTPEKYHEALELGAHGIQVGTQFAFCEESGIQPILKKQLVQFLKENPIQLFTDPQASPTGFPFKILRLIGTVGDLRVTRSKRCDLGYLRQAYQKPNGSIGYRCPGEPVADYLKKGGTIEETKGRICLCNGLTAAVGLGQKTVKEDFEPSLLTAGSAIHELKKIFKPGKSTYSAKDVINYLLNPSPV